MLSRILETADFLKGKMTTQPDTAIILGTGLGGLSKEITDTETIIHELRIRENNILKILMKRAEKD